MLTESERDKLDKIQNILLEVWDKAPPQPQRRLYVCLMLLDQVLRPNQAGPDPILDAGSR